MFISSLIVDKEFPSVAKTINTFCDAFQCCQLWLEQLQEGRGKDVQLGEAVAALNEAAGCKQMFAEVPALSCFAELCSSAEPVQRSPLKWLSLHKASRKIGV